MKPTTNGMTMTLNEIETRDNLMHQWQKFRLNQIKLTPINYPILRIVFGKKSLFFRKFCVSPF